MIDDLDKTLEVLLRRELPPSLVDQLTTSFAVPDDQFPPQSVTLPAIDLFLYDVRENRELRTNEWIVERGSDGANQEAASGAGGVFVPGHRLGQQCLDHARPGGAPFAGRGNDGAPSSPHHPGCHPPGNPGGPRVALSRHHPPEPGGLESVGEFWQALEGKPKAALNYTVTVSVCCRAKTVMGNVSQEGLSAVWNSQMYQ